MHLSRFTLISLLSLAILFPAATPSVAQDYEEGGNAAGLQVRMSQLEEQMRKLQGTVEQVTYENRQLKAEMEKVNKDTDFRLQELEKKQQAPAAADNSATNPSQNPPADSGKLRPVEQPDDTAAAEAQLPKFPNSRAHYNYAFKLLNQGDKYPEAGAAFLAFTKNYPKDPLIGNAYYWLGETYYVRRDYIKAADNFRKGYEAMPTGPKAADNLLKLAMSLNALKKDKEACIVLKQVVVKFGPSSTSMKTRAEQEMNTIGCN